MSIYTTYSTDFRIGRRLGCPHAAQDHALIPIDIRYMPAIIRFRGYNPLPTADTCGERFVWHRTSLGMTQGERLRQSRGGPGGRTRA